MAENGSARRLLMTKQEYTLQTFQSSLILFANILIGIITGGGLIFAFRSGLPIGATPLHVTLCVIGYQLLMAQAILSLSPHNGWSAHLKVVDRRRAHWILQVLGSGLAIAGIFIKILDKTEHWDTLHGRFALVALVFTTVSLVNGLASLWAFEIRKRIPIPANISKLTHICFGTIAFGAAGITFCLGVNKTVFRSFSGDGIADTLITFTCFLVIIVIISPVVSFVTKIRRN